MINLHDNGRAAVLSALLASALLVPPRATAQSTHTTAEIGALVAAYDSGWNRRDTVRIGRLLAPGYQYFTSRGGVTSRVETLRFLGSPDYVLNQARRSELAVTLSGPVAVVSSRWQGHGSFRGKPFRDDQRCGQVWLKSGSTWQLLSEHCVQIQPSQPASGGT
jgi:hypothetical protein